MTRTLRRLSLPEVVFGFVCFSATGSSFSHASQSDRVSPRQHSLTTV